MTKTVQIGKHLIGLGHPPFVVAEMSGNHNQSLHQALEIVDSAARSGAHAIKIQTYTPDTITLNQQGREFSISDPSSPWYGKNLYHLYKQAYTPWEWHEAIYRQASQHGMICFSSPFDETAVEFLESIGTPAYKIASFENNHYPLIEKAALTGKPLIISTGLASVGELQQAVNTARSAGCSQLILLKCTSTYPASPRNTNLRTIPHMRELFGCEIGLSDHSLGLGVAVSAVALGASVIEKHLTLSRSAGGVDSSFSLEPEEMKRLTTEVQRAWEAIGDIKYGPTEDEEESIRLRRSIYVAKDIRAGDPFTTDNIRVVRPGLGLSPLFYPQIIGKIARLDLNSGMPLTFDALLGAL